MNHLELLKKYMKLVGECEDFSYLAHASTGPDGDFTDEELAELEHIWEEVRND